MLWWRRACGRPHKVEWHGACRRGNSKVTACFPSQRCCWCSAVSPLAHWLAIVFEGPGRQRVTAPPPVPVVLRGAPLALLGAAFMVAVTLLRRGGDGLRRCGAGGWPKGRGRRRGAGGCCWLFLPLLPLQASDLPEGEEAHRRREVYRVAAE